MPAWDAIGRVVPCPLCEYNLRGLTEPRCPECSYAFEWPELLDPARQKHPYLFEHHPRHNVWSFLRTLIGGLRPRRFWATLNPAMPSRPARLQLYAVLVVALLLVAPAAHIVPAAIRTIHGVQAERTTVRQALTAQANDPRIKRIIAAEGSLDAAVDRYCPPVFSRYTLSLVRQTVRYDWDQLPVVLVMAAWPWLTLASLMIFRWSMRRAKVRTEHVARCVVYGFDWGFWFVSILVAALSGRFAGAVVGLQAATSVAILCSLTIGVYGAYRLGSAYASYLRFDHPYATAAASQVIVFMFVTMVLIAFH